MDLASMDFGLGEDVDQLRELARQFAGNEIAPRAALESLNTSLSLTL